MKKIHPMAIMLMVWPFMFALLLWVFLSTGHPRAAHADPKPGLWQESAIHADGVTIRKIRDTTGGESNVCYVASRLNVGINPTEPRNDSVSISCVPEKRP